MRIGLVQEKQNKLYQFQEKGVRYSLDEAKEYQRDMILQNRNGIQKAIEAGCDLVVTSEAINFPGLPEKVEGDCAELLPEIGSEFFKEFGKMARDGNCYLALGAYRKEVLERKAKWYNSVFLYDRQGSLCEVYDKVHLAGEENQYLERGNRYCVVETDFGRIGMAICWDMQFAETCQTLADMGADLIVAPTWGWEWLYGACRAYENGVYVASAMAVPFSGRIEGDRSPSEIIAPTGGCLARGNREMEQVVLGEISDLRDCAFYREFRKKGRRQKLAAELSE